MTYLISHGYVTHEDGAKCPFCAKVKKQYLGDRKSGHFFQIMENKKPILNDAIKIFSDEEIITHVINLYPDMEKSKEGFEKVLKELRTTKPVRTQMEIEVTKVKDEDEEYVDVSGSKPKTKISYGLEFTPWNKWLGMKIAKVSLLHFNYLDIVAHCLWEMTWTGFNQEEIADQLKELTDKVKEVKNSKKK